MQREIRIDAPGAGAWIMERAEGYFRDGVDHAFSSHRNGQILGGFALVGYTGGAMTVHMAAEDPRWCSRELLWLPFHYAFEQLGLKKLIAPVRSDNYQVLDMDLRGGWRIEAVLHDVLPRGDMILLGMTRDTCPWLDYAPRQWRDNRRAA